MQVIDRFSEIPKDPSWGMRGTAGAVFAGNVTFENVSYAVRGKSILSDVSLELAAGCIACLLGPSGCGKTTLLKLAAGVLRPSEGRVFIDEVEVAGRSRFVPPEKRNVGLMFQDFALFPHMTVAENVAYGLYALSKPEAQKVALRALERVGLKNVANRYPVGLSGGEQQRVALARAIVPRPQVILMDEPFSGLDQRLRESVRAETLALVRETRATCLLVTHDPNEALAFADQIFLMQNGRLVQSGTPQQLVEQPLDASVARFFRGYNEFRGTVTNGVVWTAVGELPAAAFRSGAAVEVLVPTDGLSVQPVGQGVSARVLENRFDGVGRRLKLQLEGTETTVEVAADVNTMNASGSVCGLVVSSNRHQVFLQTE